MPAPSADGARQELRTPGHRRRVGRDLVRRRASPSPERCPPTGRLGGAYSVDSVAGRFVLREGAGGQTRARGGANGKADGKADGKAPARTATATRRPAVRAR